MSKRIFMSLLALLLIGVQAFAQSTVSGKVTDQAGQPLVGVNVMVKGTQTGTMTDLDGNWTLNNLRPNAILVFSSIGFASQEIPVGSMNEINVTLSEDRNLLDQVVVVGYGTARKKDVSGAIASVNYGNDKNIVNLPNPNALAALSSKVAGFSYAPTSTAGGDNTATMTIRGKNVIPTGASVADRYQGVNQPLLVIDGVLSYGSINSINTADIQSIDVLKDASAAAIYGSRAANGVIIITTKKGASMKPVVALNASVSLSDWTRIPARVMDDETFLKNRFYSQQGAGNKSFTGKKWEDYQKLSVAAGELLNSDAEFPAFEQGVKTDWLKEISRIGVGQKYDLSVSGKSQHVNYYVSGDYTRQQGIRLGDDYMKYGVLAKMDINVTDWLTVGVKGNYLGSKNWGQTARIQNATWVSPYSFTHARQKGFENWPNSKPDGSSASPLWGSGANDSYLWTDRTSHSANINGVGYAQIDFPFIPGLSYRFTMQGQYNTGNTDVFNNPEIKVDTDNTAHMSYPAQFSKEVGGYSWMNRTNAWNIDNVLTYARDFGDHHFDAMVGYTREHSNYEALRVDFKGFDMNTKLGVYKMDAADPANTQTKRSRTVSSAIGYIARANYNFRNTYYATVNFRRDGYSAFAEGRKWGNFYGASAAWVISNEGFMRNQSLFDFLKLRLSWGQNGSRSVTPYQTLATVKAVASNNGMMTYTWLGNASAYGAMITGIANRALTWATVEKFNAGLDFSTLAGRLNGSIDVYTGKTRDMIMTRSVPYMTGYTTAYDNVGRVTNDGVEIVLNSVNIDGDGRNSFRWESSLVFDANRNCVKELYGKGADGKESDDVANALAYGFDSYYALQVGHPIGSAYDLKKLGIFQSEDEVKSYVDKDGKMIQPKAVPGDIKFEDWNGDGKISGADRHFIGSPDPLFTVNLGNTLSWKNFSLYFNFRWAQGDKEHFLWFDPNAFETTMTGGAQLAAVKPWTETNHTDKYPRYGWSKTKDYELKYQFWNQRTFLKLKDLSFSYSFNENLVQKIGLGGARIYVAATDLFTLTSWSGLDPENAGTIAGNAASSRFGSNGTYKTVTFGVNLTF